MTKRIAVPSKNLELLIVGPTNSFLASRVQKVTLDKTIPHNAVDEHGNPLHVGIVKDMPEIKVEFTTFDTGIKMFAALTGNSATAFPAGGVTISSLGQMDGILGVKDDVLATYTKSAVASKLQITQFSYDYSVGGEAQEDYTAEGSIIRWLKYNAVVDKFIALGTTATLTQTPIQLASGNYLISVIADGTYLTETTGVPASGYYSVSGKTLTLGAAYTTQLLVVYHANAGLAWTSVSDGSMPPSIKGKDVQVVILANDIPRVQSVSIKGNMNAKAVKEMGNRQLVGYEKDVPSITGSITVLDTDTDLISMLTTGVTASGIEWLPGEGCSTTPITLAIQLLDPCSTVPPINVLKTIYLPNVSIVGDSYTSNINGNAQQVFNWESNDSQVIIYSGNF